MALLDLTALWFGRYLLAGIAFAVAVNLIGSLRGIGWMLWEEFVATVIVWPLVLPVGAWVAYMERSNKR